LERNLISLCHSLVPIAIQGLASGCESKVLLYHKVTSSPAVVCLWHRRVPVGKFVYKLQSIVDSYLAVLLRGFFPLLKLINQCF